MNINNLFHRKSKPPLSTEYFLDIDRHECHFYSDCKNIRKDIITEVSGDDWALKYYRYKPCPRCETRNAKELANVIKYALVAAFANILLSKPTNSKTK